MSVELKLKLKLKLALVWRCGSGVHNRRIGKVQQEASEGETRGEWGRGRHGVF